MAGRPQIPAEKREAILADARADVLSSREIGERYGVCTATVDLYAKRAGIRRTQGSRIKYPCPSPGTIFGKWKVIGEEEVRRPGGYRLILCQCQCPALAEQLVNIDALYGGRSSSCASCAHRQHGLSGHDLYHIWGGMMTRCYNSASLDWQGYGAKGVTVHGDWHDVRNFIAWIEANLGPRPEPDRRVASGNGWWTLDRIDPFGNYEPGNLRWAEPPEQRANQRNPNMRPTDCPACLMAFPSKLAARQHYRAEHDKPCEMCGRWTRSTAGVCSRPGPCRAEYMRRYDAGLTKSA